MVMNPTVTKMDNWMTILKQMGMEALVLVAALYSTWKQATDLQTKLGASADWYIHVSQAYRQEEKFAHRNCIRECSSDGQTSLPFPYFRKISGRAKACALCIEKKKKAPSERGKQTTYKCKQCDLPLCRVGCFLEYHKQRNVEVQN